MSGTNTVIIADVPAPDEEERLQIIEQISVLEAAENLRSPSVDRGVDRKRYSMSSNPPVYQRQSTLDTKTTQELKAVLAQKLANHQGPQTPLPTAPSGPLPVTPPRERGATFSPSSKASLGGPAPLVRSPSSNGQALVRSPSNGQAAGAPPAKRSSTPGEMGGNSNSPTAQLSPRRMLPTPGQVQPAQASAPNTAASPAPTLSQSQPTQATQPVQPVATPLSRSGSYNASRATSGPPKESFPLQLRLPSGQQLILSCAVGITGAEFLAEIFPKVKEFLDQSAALERASLVTEELVSVQSADILSSTNYIATCRKDTTIPLLLLRLQSELPAVPKQSSSKSFLGTRPVTTNFSGTIATSQLSPTADRSGPSSPTATPAEEVAQPRPKRTTTLSEDNFKGLQGLMGLTNSKGTFKKQIREFPVQFLLPGGQTLVITCSVDDTITQVKEELHKRATRFGLRNVSHYVLKMPSAGYVNDENVQLGSIPFIEACRAQSTIPKFNLIEKSGALSKKEKMINLEIGSLLGSPLGWTQDNSEISQFRKSMTWERYKEKNASPAPRAEEPDRKIASPEPVTPMPSKMIIKLRLPLIESTLEKKVIIEGDTANDVLRNLFAKHYEKQLAAKGMVKKYSDFVLKATGFADYIEGDKDFTSFDYIRNCIAKKEEIRLSLVESENNDNDLYVEDFPDEEFIQDPIIRFDHEEIKSDSMPWDQLTSISIWELTRQFKLKIVGVENIKLPAEIEGKQDNLDLYITAGIYHGGELVCPLMTSQIIGWNANPRWYEWLNSSIQMCNLPRASRICFSLFAKTTSKKEDVEVPLGWVGCQLVDYKHELRTGLMSLNMWPDGPANPIGTCVSNASSSAPTLFIEFETFAMPVVFPTEPLNSSELPVETGSDFEFTVRKPTISAKAKNLMGIQQDAASAVDKLASTDPLYPLTENDKKILWSEREYCKTKPHSLPKFLTAVAYNDRFAIQIMHQMIRSWSPINPVDALELLDSKFGDAKVRSFAVQCLEALSDDELLDYLLQLVQVLKYEPYHDSSLARFLLRRSLRNRRIGHSFFWYLKAEMHVSEISERFGLLIEAYLRGCGLHRAELKKQTGLLKDLVRIANHIKGFKDTERRAVLLDELGKMQLTSKIQLPLNPSFEVSGIKVDKCKYMDSKKLPLWVVFNNADSNGPDKYVMFKCGDDLRQDMLTLQMIRFMDKLWQKEGLNLELNPYGCIATGNDEGMIEVVLNSNTVANITRNAGGATAAFRADPIANWIRSNNPKDDQYAKAVDNFILSCAGYCVATYVLGVGDRHNDNVMLTRDGKLFHIDFGHFLGNYKKKFGMKRERAPFVFTPDFAFVMGGRDSKDFMKFVDICCRAYNILRKHANVFINLFAMMLSTGIPELTSVEDISYLREAFSLDATDEKAREKFKNLIYEALTTKTTQLNNAIHILAH
eukprot:TRINITY_DN4532_c0_g2_i2.p1 TRINITY_DN4532_c0_g2~~TRINITY_DN4532_c0_g2_i2.p1  ORF type:complete len:1434 (+),score=438.70 TRINITY_DN4532_c0_g2_i2:87-4388(+)